MSARTYKITDCPASISNGVLLTWFDFYVWPSDTDLAYALTTTLGNISEPTIIDRAVEFSKTFELTDVIEFDFILEEISSYNWETKCYSSDGSVVDDVTIEMDGLTTLRASAAVFGVVRIKGRKRGAKCRLSTTLVKTMYTAPTEEEFSESDAGQYYTYADFMAIFFNETDVGTWEDEDGVAVTVDGVTINQTGISLDNLQASVTAHWIDKEGELTTETLNMEIPPCVQDLLEACGVDTDGDGIIDDWSGVEDAIEELNQEICGGGYTPPINVYVSSCSGKELMAISSDEDDNSWCGG